MPAIAPRQFQPGLSYTIPTVNGQPPFAGLAVIRGANGSATPAFGLAVAQDPTLAHLQPAVISTAITFMLGACNPPVGQNGLSPVCSGLNSISYLPACDSTANGSIVARANATNAGKVGGLLMSVQAGFAGDPAAICFIEQLQPALAKSMNYLKESNSGEFTSTGARSGTSKKVLLALAAFCAATTFLIQG